MMWELRENSILFFSSTFHFECTNFQQQLTYYVSDSRLRWQAPNAQYPDKTVTTQPLSNRKSPKVIVTQSTFDSFTLSFDHFAPGDYSHEYVALFKPVSSSRWISQEEEVPKQDLPSIKITNLRPNTKYEARIGKSYRKKKIKYIIFLHHFSQQSTHLFIYSLNSDLRRLRDPKLGKINGSN